MDATTEKIIETYIKIRDAKDAKAREHKAEIAKFDEQMQVLEDELKVRCEEAGGNITTPVGYVKRKLSTRFWTSDWASLYKFIKEHDAFHLLHQRISTLAMQQFLEDNPEAVPPGLNADKEYTVVVTRKS